MIPLTTALPWNVLPPRKHSLARRNRQLFVIGGVFSLLLSGCAIIHPPSNNRDWDPDNAVLSTAEIQGDQVIIHNVRSDVYHGDQVEVVRYDKVVDLNQLDSVYFIVVPFPGMPSLAHTMLSFGFDGRDYVGVSAEVRKRKGQAYSAVMGAMGLFELTYVVADERDLIGSRSNKNLSEVLLYRTRATPQQARTLFVNIMQRVNGLAVKPELYNTFTNNCTTNIWEQVNRVVEKKVPYGYEVLMPGYADRLAYDAGLIDTDLPFEEARRQALVAYQAYRYRDCNSSDFSVALRHSDSADSAAMVRR